MTTFLFTLLIGLLGGLIDVLPMIKMKMDKYSNFSAFVHYLIAPFIIFSIEWGLPWWLKGGLLNLLLAIPVIILAAKDDKKSIIPMTIMSIVLGTLMGVVGYLVI